MAKYEKPWLSLDEQVDKLAAYGVDVGGREHAIRDSGIVRRHSYQAGWANLVARCLDGGDEDVSEEHRRMVIEMAALLTGDDVE